MTEEKKLNINAIGQIIDTTFGRSSTPKCQSYSVKFSMPGYGRLAVSYAAVVNFGSERRMIDVQKNYKEEAESIIAAAIKNIKQHYKELTDETLYVKLIPNSISDSTEIINLNVHNAKRTAYIRRKAIYEIR